MADQLGDACSDDLDCSSIADGLCLDAVCRCRRGRTPSSSLRCRSTILGDPCRLQHDCPPANSTCRVAAPANASTFSFRSNASTSDDLRCLCASGFRRRVGEPAACVARRLGDECHVDADCADAIPLAACSWSGRCACPLDHDVTFGDADDVTAAAHGVQRCVAPRNDVVDIVIVGVSVVAIGVLSIVDVFLVAYLSAKLVRRRRRRHSLDSTPPRTQYADLQRSDNKM